MNKEPDGQTRRKPSLINKSKLRKILILALAFSCFLSALTVTANALYGYGTDEDYVLNQFIDTYGWDRSKMTAYTWTGIDGNTYYRQSDYEKSYYEDVYKTNEELAITLGLISAVPEACGSSAGMVALAIQEWKDGNQETPLGSNYCKYNTWYYGRPVSGDSYPWCCAFISWLADQCGLIEDGTYTKTAGCACMADYFRGKGYESWGILQSTPYGGTETPVPGDILIWAGGAHIGLIVKVNDDSIETIEGNAGDRVSHNTYGRSAATGYIAGSTVWRVHYPDTETTIFHYLVNNLQLPPAAAIGVVANISSESNFNDQALGDNGTSYGICQWHNGRWDTLKSICSEAGLPWETVDGQLYYLKWELETRYPGLLNTLRSQPNTADGAYQAAWAWCHDFEVPQGYEGPTSTYRGNMARNVFWPKYVQLGLV